MSWKNSNIRYGGLAISLHWLMFFLMVGVYAFIELREIFPKGSDARQAMKDWHFMLGLCVLLLTIPRLTIRLSSTAPDIEPVLPAWQQRLARLIHVLLYTLMLAMPVLGWLLLSAAGKPIPFFGWQLPPLIAENKDTAELIKEIHETIGTAGYFLIGLHVIATGFHQYIVRDNTLNRMLPLWLLNRTTANNR